MAVDDDIVRIDKFYGLRNNVRPEAFALGDLEAATNFNIDDELRLQSRKGFGAPIFAGSYHSLFANAGVMVAVVGGALQRLLPAGGAPIALRSGLTGPRLSYAPVGARIYYTDGVSTGCVDAGAHRSWGIEPPSAQPVATAVGGNLRAGTYQYAVTYLRADGQPSGTGVAGSITLTAAGGITFSAIPVSWDPTVTQKKLYISPVNGDKLYRQMVLPAAAVTATYDNEVAGTEPLETQFLQPPIAGQIIAAGPGRVYVARGRKLYCTEAYKPELMDLRRGFTMPSHITLVAPVDDGLWLGTADEIIFLAGGDPSKFEYRPRVTYGAIAGALAYGNAEDIDPTLGGLAAIVGTRQGICACLNGGIIKNLTKDRFSYPTTERGAGVVRNHGGMTQYLMVLEGTESAANVAF